MRTGMIVGFVAALTSASLTGQSTPPIQTVTVEGATTKFYRGLNTLIVTTVDGVQQVYRFTKGLVVHGGKGPGVEALDTLHEGVTVVVHYRIEGGEQTVEEIDRVADEGLKVTEGVMVRLNRRRREITLKFGDGTTETLRLTDRAASEATEDIGPGGSTRVTVYYSDESGRKVAHYFTKTP